MSSQLKLNIPYNFYFCFASLSASTGELVIISTLLPFKPYIIANTLTIVDLPSPVATYNNLPCSLFAFKATIQLNIYVSVILNPVSKKFALLTTASATYI